MNDYDKERLRNDPQYREKVLNNMARKARSRWFYTKMRTAFYVLATFVLLALGIFAGARLTPRQADWVTLIIICLFVVPLMGWMLIAVRQHRKDYGADSWSEIK